jgi:hypothetical protein
LKRSDYRGLKKRISAIRRWQEGLEPQSSSILDKPDPHAEVGNNPSRGSWSTSEQYGRKQPNRRRLSMPTCTRSRPNSVTQPMPLYAILLTLPPIHLKFFVELDGELEKINSFYSEREKEAQIRSKALQVQLRELKDHRKIFYVSKLTSSLQVRDIRSDLHLSKRNRFLEMVPPGQKP